MKMIKREMYLPRIRPFYDSDLIKILVGIRRCGKSVIMNQIADELISSGVSKDHIVKINYELVEFSDIITSKALNDYVRSKIKSPGKYYIFIDEIQKVEKYEEAVNSLRVSEDCSIFISGSNGKLLASELSTELTGRYIEFRIQPFTYREVKQLFELNGRVVNEDTFYDYIKWGGMPQRLWFDEEREVRTYLSDLYDSIVMKDVVKRFKVSDPDLLERLTDYLMDNSARLFSASNLVKYLKKDGRDVSTGTIYNYTNHIMSSLIVSDVKRYDTKGKKVLKRSGKFFCVDTGLRQVRVPDANSDVGVLLETVVYNELVARGYDVFVGKTPKAEVDFIATRGGQKYYIQVCYMMSEQRIIDREFAPFNEISDFYPRIVLSLDKLNMSHNGVAHMNVIDFLLSDEF